MDWGMKNRMAQLIQSDGHCLFLPVDHGYFQGPTRKLEEPRKTIEPLLPYADALFITRGVLRSSVDPDNSKPIILRVSLQVMLLVRTDEQAGGKSVKAPLMSSFSRF